MDKTKVFLLDQKHYQRLLSANTPVMRIISRMIAESENPDTPIVIIDDCTVKHMHFYKDKMCIKKLPFDYGNVYFLSDMYEFYADFWDYMTTIRDSVYPDCNDNEIEQIFEGQCVEYEKQFTDVFVLKVNLCNQNDYATRSRC